MTDAGPRGLGLAEHTALFEQSAVPTLVVDHHRRAILQVNVAALGLLGLEEEHILGRPGTDFLLGTSDEKAQRLRALRGDETALLLDVVTPTGLRPAEVTIIPSGIEGVAFVQLVDLTDLLAAADRADTHHTELERTTAALRTIAGRLAHDLRSPMTSIAGFSNLLIEHADELTDDERANLLQRIRANIDAVGGMADAILSEADVGAPRPQDESRSAEDLFELVRAVTDGQLIDAGGTMLTRATTASLPVPVGTIRQAVINLVTNSIKYRHPDRTLRVELEVRGGDDGEAEIVVRDNGQGLGADLETLLTSGARGEASVGTHGRGLGLAFVKAAVNSIGGTFTSAPLEPGTEMTITLPPTPPVSRSSEDRTPDVPVTRAALSGAQLHRILQESPVACYVIDMPLRQIVEVNQAGAALVGLAPEQIVGRAGSDFVDEADVADALRRQVIDAPDVAASVRTTLRGADGPVSVRIQIAAVEGTALAVAQAITDDPELGTLQHG